MGNAQNTVLIATTAQPSHTPSASNQVVKVVGNIYEELIVLALALGAVILKDGLQSLLYNKKMLGEYFRRDKAKSTEVDRILNEILILASADRVIFAQFHNGHKYLSGLTKLQVSITHTRCSNNIPKLDTPSSILIDDIYHEYTVAPVNSFSWVESLKIESPCTKYMEKHGIQSFAMTTVACNKGKFFTLQIPVGMIGIHYLRKKMKVDDGAKSRIDKRLKELIIVLEST